MKIDIFDTTLRDGFQQEGISPSVKDKLAIAKLIDELGVDFIEGGWPGASPKEKEFFDTAKKDLNLNNAKLVSFGSTRKLNTKVEEDPQVQALIDSDHHEKEAFQIVELKNLEPRKYQDCRHH